MNKKVFKAMWLSVMAVAVVIVSSCSSDSDFFGLDGVDYIESIENNQICENPLINDGYIDYIDNQYVIKISKRQALAKGISKDYYNELEISIAKGNEMLRKIIDSCTAKGNTVIVESSLYSDNSKRYSLSRTLSTDPEANELPRGLIVTTGQETGKAGVERLPTIMRSVKCNCLSNVALVPIQIVVASSFGNSNIKSGVGKNLNLHVGFPASNVPGGIEYSTTDSYGGRCAWAGDTTHISSSKIK